MAPVCKHCDQPAKKYLYERGHGPAYAKTCGGSKCRHKGRSTMGPLDFIYPKKCRHCGMDYLASTPTSRYCKTCVPNKTAASRLQRYGITHSEFTTLLEKQNHKCAICGAQSPSSLDHNHSTNELRGVLCVRCNMGIAWLENREWRDKAEIYLTTGLDINGLLAAMKSL